MILWVGLVVLAAGVVLVLGPVGWNVANDLQRPSDEEYERLNDRRDWD